MSFGYQVSNDGQSTVGSFDYNSNTELTVTLNGLESTGSLDIYGGLYVCVGTGTNIENLIAR